MRPNVKCVKKRDRDHYVLRWTDPDTGAERQRRTQATTKAAALKEAGRLEEEILTGRYDASGAILWEHARQRHKAEKLPELRPSTIKKYRETLDEVQRVVHPHRLTDLDASRISIFQSKLRDRGLRPASIRSHLTHLRAFLRWCEDVELLKKAPRVKLPSLRGTGKLMKGRPLTDNEFRSMLDATESVVGPQRVAAWRHYLEGMWLSGLRLRESLLFEWRGHGVPRVELGGRRPMLFIPAEYDKGGKDRCVPITPDFAEFLQQTPDGERTGPIFRPPGRDGRVANPIWVSRVVARIGENAGVIVDEQTKKHASVHDFRRSFGVRWAARIPVHALRELMRHASLSTTMDYYVGQDADRTADLIWQSHPKCEVST
ncbi:site-specific tyrosine recombinase XerC [Botrimarina colliarenosi]|uniref:Site-specific tyrosine recombinase XerC n=1 Tax=Botrimarina colliarenosi TaxID=2528001 RepID=A0A5C6AMJ8_9BACT|nr:tyrosine-type recombinase/integrase [Botrimarina colliarenosi]TWU00222.1 site-specific tyrosine recombinase XerC [Botrimarina colliarenosi]